MYAISVPQSEQRMVRAYHCHGRSIPRNLRLDRTMGRIMLVANIVTLVGLVLVVVLCGLSVALPKHRGALAASTFVIACAIAIRAVFTALAENVVAHRATVDLPPGSQKEAILTEAFNDTLPRLALAAGALVLALGLGLFAFRALRARVASILVGAVLFGALGWMGTRGVGIHERMAREVFVQVASSEDRCLALGDAVRSVGGIDAAERYEPRVRRLGHDCVASWLDALDRGGAERERLEERARLARMMTRIKSASPLDLIEESGLLVDDAQKLEIAKRKASVASAGMAE